MTSYRVPMKFAAGLIAENAWNRLMIERLRVNAPLRHGGLGSAVTRS
jgi:hypothetical protein